MGFIQWTQDLEIGVVQVDQEHQSLVDAINRLHDAMMAGETKQAVYGMFQFLANYVTYHFGNEEAVMETIHYPNLQHHRALHKTLTSQVKSILEQIRDERKPITPEPIRFIKDWLTHHIREEDKAIGVYLLTHKLTLDLPAPKGTHSHGDHDKQ